MKRDCLGREDFLITAKTAAKGFNDDQDLIQKATLPIQLPPSNLAFASCYSATLPKTQKPCLNAVLDAVLAFYHLKPQGRCGIFSGSTDVRLFQGLYPLTTLILDALVPVVVW